MTFIFKPSRSDHQIHYYHWFWNACTNRGGPTLDWIIR